MRRKGAENSVASGPRKGEIAGAGSPMAAGIYRNSGIRLARHGQNGCYIRRVAKLLIVEDEPEIARYIAEVAQGAGHTSLVADSAAFALELLRGDLGFDALIVDHHLGLETGETGIAFLAQVRKSGRHRQLPAIVCTADAKPETIHGFLALNIFAFLKKPFRPERLTAELEKLFGARPAAPRAPAPAAPATAAAKPAKIVRGE
jgi:CheY-like chemotaxis protein